MSASESYTTDAAGAAYFAQTDSSDGDGRPSRRELAEDAVLDARDRRGRAVPELGLSCEELAWASFEPPDGGWPSGRRP